MCKELVNLCKRLMRPSINLCWCRRTPPSSCVNDVFFDDIEQWLNKNEGNHSLLKDAANYLGYWHTTAFHLLLEAQPPSALVERFLQLLPDAIKIPNHSEYPLHTACRSNASPAVVKMLIQAHTDALDLQDISGCSALHLACHHDASPDIVKILLEAHPKAAEVKDDFGSFPIHLACKFNVFPDAVKMLVEAYPGALEVPDSYGDLPLHYACKYDASIDVVKMLLEAYPKATAVQNNSGELPLHLACHHACQCSLNGDVSLELLDLLLTSNPESMNIRDEYGELASAYITDMVEPNSTPNEGQFYNSEEASIGPIDSRENSFQLHSIIAAGYSANLLKFLLQAFPESCMKQDNNGMIPLHHAMASKSPHFFAYVMTLLDANSTSSLIIQDNEGRTPLQLQDENGMLPMHRLANFSHDSLSDKTLQLLANAYPESIMLVDKNGMLPFHHACLNPASTLEVLILFINLSPEVVDFSEKSNFKQRGRSGNLCKRKRI